MDQPSATPEVNTNKEIDEKRCAELQAQARLVVMGRIGEHVPPESTTDGYKLVCSLLAKEQYGDATAGLQMFAEGEPTDRHRHLAEQITGRSEDEAGTVDGLPATFVHALDAYAESRVRPYGKEADPVDSAVSAIIEENGGANLISDIAHGDAGYGYRGATSVSEFVSQMAYDATESLLPDRLIQPETYPDVEAAMSRYALIASTK